MENVLLDQSPRSTLDASLSRSTVKSIGSYSSYSSSSSGSSSSSYSPYSSSSSISHLLYNYNVPVPPAMQKLNTVPNLHQKPDISFSPLPLPQPNYQPPLLPLPPNKHSSLPSSCNNKFISISTPSIPRRKPRAPKKEPKVQTNKSKKPPEKTMSTFSASAAATAASLANTLHELEDEVVIVTHVKDTDRFDRYYLSPPPSSLPLPGLSLLRRKTKISDSYNGASDDLRRILRL